MLKIGFQYEPVLSITAWLQPSWMSQSRRSSSSPSIVPNFSNLYLRLGLQRSRHDTNNQKLLADVDPGATLDHCLNHFLSLRMSSQRKKDQVVPRAQRLQSEVRRRWPDQINVRGLATITVAILAHPQTHFHPPRWPRIGRPWGH